MSFAVIDEYREVTVPPIVEPAEATIHYFYDDSSSKDRLDHSYAAHRLAHNQPELLPDGLLAEWRRACSRAGHGDAGAGRRPALERPSSFLALSSRGHRDPGFSRAQKL